MKRAMIEWLGPVIVEYYAATEGGAGTLVDSHDLAEQARHRRQARPAGLR